MVVQEGETSDSRTPPTPDGIPLLGNMVAFARNPVQAMERWASLGDFVRLQAPGQSLYLITGPEVIEQILRSKHDRFTIGPEQRKTFRGVEDHAVTMTTGERWKRLRRALHPAFTRAKIGQYADRMVSVTERHIEPWEDGERIDLLREMRLLTVSILAEALLDVDIRGSEDLVMAAADALVDRANFRRPGQLLPNWIPTPTDRRFERSVQKLDTYVDGIIAERRKQRGEDVCTLLLEAHDRGELSMDELRHNLVALLLAGHDSPAVGLTYTWYLLSDNHDVGNELVRESRGVGLDGRLGSDAYESLAKTRHAVSEALRLYPPTTGVNREATEPVSLGGYDFEAGAQFLVPQWVVHRDERYWDDPTSFIPSRWADPSNRPEFAYFPFSGGPRLCIGNDFAHQTLTLALATMIGRLTLDITIDEPLTFTPSIQLRPEQDISAVVRRH